MTDLFQVVTCREPERWDRIVTSFSRYDVYYLSGYVKAFRLHGDGEPLLFYYRNGAARAMYVAMKRDIRLSPFFRDYPFAGALYDLITPYGYGGPLFEGTFSSAESETFGRAYDAVLKEERMVCDFVRFHPVLGNADDCRSLYEVTDLGPTVSMRLESEDSIRADLSVKNRNKIRKARKNGVEIFHGRTTALFDDFIRIYNATMDKDGADAYYYFGREFYDSLHNDLSGNYEIFYAVYEGKIIAMSIILFAGGRMHYHLSGSVYEYRSLAPTNLLLYTAARWGLEQGFTDFHLGGGVGAADDNLLKFKQSFNRHTAHRFSIGKKIIDRKMYDRLVRYREKTDPAFDAASGYFPLYRS